jgi:hypothetical protein
MYQAKLLPEVSRSFEYETSQYNGHIKSSIVAAKAIRCYVIRELLETDYVGFVLINTDGAQTNGDQY